MHLRQRLKVRRVRNRYISITTRIRDRLEKPRQQKRIAVFVFGSFCRSFCRHQATYRDWIKHLHARRREGIL